MAGLNVSIAFFLSVVAICEVVRQVSKRLLPLGVYRDLVRELVSSLQLCACCLELRMLMDIGPWGGGFGPDVILTLRFILYLIHGVSFDGASANPTVTLQEFLVMDSSFVVTAVKLLVQCVGMEAAGILTTHYWSWELTDFHLIQNLMALDCNSSIHTSLYHGIFVEGVCSFFFHLVALKFQHNDPRYRAPILAVTVTTLAYTGEELSTFLSPPVTSWCKYKKGTLMKLGELMHWLFSSRDLQLCSG